MEAGGVNYYSFHIGDYTAHTAHLEPMEDLAYRRMLDLYYRTEQPLPRDIKEIARLIRLKGHDKAISVVIDEFFDDCADGWAHGRCDDELARMQDKQAKARASAQASVSARSANAQRTQSERSTDVQRTLNERSATNTNTNTNTTIAPKEHRARASRLPPEWQPGDEGMEYARKHGFTTSQAFDELAAFRDWWAAAPGQKGVKADWDATWRTWCRKSTGAPKPTAQGFAERASAAKAERLAEMTGGLLGAPQRPSNVIDMEEGNAPLRIA
jgi:uncharacterized protein YdaU (DUF1376 family)